MSCGWSLARGLLTESFGKDRAGEGPYPPCCPQRPCLLSLVAMTKIVRPCPVCGREVDFEKAPYRPFCSRRCKLVDLGAWLEERYVLSSPLEDESEEEAPLTGAGGREGHGC